MVARSLQACLKYEVCDFETPSPETVLKKHIPGQDGREYISNTTDWPYSIHCHLELLHPNGKKFCGSGAMVGPHHVLTCGHCVYKFDKKNPSGSRWFKKITASPALNGKMLPFGSIEVTKAYIFKNWFHNGDEEVDIALLILGQSIGRYTGWGGLLCTTDTELFRAIVNITGYPGDKGYTQLWGMSSNLKEVYPERLMHEIDTAGGQSGSPIYITENASPLIVGIHTSGMDQKYIDQELKTRFGRGPYDASKWDTICKDPWYQSLVNSGTRITEKKFKHLLVEKISETYIIDFSKKTQVSLFTILHSCIERIVQLQKNIEELQEKFINCNNQKLHCQEKMCTCVASFYEENYKSKYSKKTAACEQAYFQKMAMQIDEYYLDRESLFFNQRDKYHRERRECYDQIVKQMEYKAEQITKYGSKKMGGDIIHSQKCTHFRALAENIADCIAQREERTWHYHFQALDENIAGCIAQPYYNFRDSHWNIVRCIARQEKSIHRDVNKKLCVRQELDENIADYIAQQEACTRRALAENIADCIAQLEKRTRHYHFPAFDENIADYMEERTRHYSSVLMEYQFKCVRQYEECNIKLNECKARDTYSTYINGQHIFFSGAIHEHLFKCDRQYEECNTNSNDCKARDTYSTYINEQHVFFSSAIHGATYSLIPEIIKDAAEFSGYPRVASLVNPIMQVGLVVYNGNSLTSLIPIATGLLIEKSFNWMGCPPKLSTFIGASAAIATGVMQGSVSTHATAIVMDSAGSYMGSILALKGKDFIYEKWRKAST